MSRRRRGPASFSFASIRDAIFTNHDFEITPLWDWVKVHGRVPARAKRTWDIVSPVWGIYAAITPPDSGGQESEDDRRLRGVWSALEQCFRDAVARSREAAFLVQFAEILSKARSDLRTLTKKLDTAGPRYLQSLRTYVEDLAGRLGQPKRRRRRTLNRIDLPGPATLRRLGVQFRAVDRDLAALHTDLTRRLSSPVPVAPRPRRGHPGRLLLKKVQATLFEAGFQNREVQDMVNDRRSEEHATARTKERRRHRRRTGAKKPPRVGKFSAN